MPLRTRFFLFYNKYVYFVHTPPALRFSPQLVLWLWDIQWYKSIRLGKHSLGPLATQMAIQEGKKGIGIKRNFWAIFLLILFFSPAFLSTHYLFPYRLWVTAPFLLAEGTSA